jgi:hypothetical protein
VASKVRSHHADGPLREPSEHEQALPAASCCPELPPLAPPPPLVLPPLPAPPPLLVGMPPPAPPLAGAPPLP